MPRFIVIHHAPGVTQEQFASNVPEVLKGKHAKFIKSYVNLTKGLIINLYEGESSEAVGRELERIGFPFDEIEAIEWEATADDLRKMM
jgi:hypothetical protein